MNKRIYWKKVKQRGAIIWDNADNPSHPAGYPTYIDGNDEIVEDRSAGWFPTTYYFRYGPNGLVDPYTAYSALRPCGDKRNPHEFEALVYDEDEGMYDGWQDVWIAQPLAFQTELEFVRQHTISDGSGD
ncbi:hypothetical protein [Lactiplantibacillus plantarum]|uniref:hypothetical protein n=1 Tax=Lactiplantibacillus plantarum TaxID=1590 RepID=UPI00217CDAC6|nr:hypothetical protein [Lactiplantibacillus plantarum]UWF30255.1 hypothetical protein NYR27_09435 [Lactiplantibacillus plantarum]UWF40305.1 hypothetical protein NYR28_06070 [Lactiplantibacillus plantarum]UWF43304.1 hypothetical protein NYR31_06080 [Lactiplantibacillus plantarum]